MGSRPAISLLLGTPSSPGASLVATKEAATRRVLCRGKPPPALAPHHVRTASHFVLTVLTVCALALPAYAEEDMMNVYGDPNLISLATGYQQQTKDAPATVTVLTAKDIEATGATTLTEALQWVPGVHIGTALGINEVVSVRGLFDGQNNQVLILINGFRVTDVVNSGPATAWTYPAQNISRVEIIRGPSSALYGADAVAGVINIVTKPPSELRGIQAGAYGGDFDTSGGWLLGGWQRDRFDFGFSAIARKTDGHEGLVLADDQTRIDAMIGSTASNAPGTLNVGREDLLLQAELGIDQFLRSHISYQKITGAGTGLGLSQALDPQGGINAEIFAADVTIYPIRSDAFDLTASLSYLSHDTDSRFDVYPPGAVGGLFPEGMRLDIESTAYQIRGEIKGLYKSVEDHTFYGGVGFDLAKLDDVTTEKNFGIDNTGTIVAFPFFADTRIHGVPSFLDPRSRDLFYVYVQDEWHFAPDWVAVAGIRYDHYSDFGDSINPRISLVWNMNATTTAKLLYGHSFRPPSFVELYSNTGGLFLGDPSLEPEELRSVELHVNKRWTPKFETTIGAYRIELEDVIAIGAATPSSPATLSQYVALPGSDSWGVELSVKYRFNDAWRIETHALLQDFRGERTRDIGYAPETLISSTLNWDPAANWTLFAGLKWVGDREREDIDTRSNIDDYVWSTLSIERQRLFELVDVRLTINNVFDDEALEPSNNQFSVPGDIPMAERSVFFQLSTQF